MRTALESLEERVDSAHAPSHDESARLGTLEAEVFNLRLRLVEAQARESRLRQLTGEPTEGLRRDTPVAADDGDALELARLRDQLHHYEGFAQAINSSLGWRTMRRLRSLVGRRWATTTPDIRPTEAGEVALLRKEVDMYAGYVRAVQESSSWRVLQLIRGLAGRRW